MKMAPEIKMSSWSYHKHSLDDPIELRTKIFNTYGDIAWKKLGGFTNFSIGNPIYAQHILEDNQDNYFNKHPLLLAVISPFFGHNGVFSSNNLEQWYKDRLIAKMSFEGQVYFKNYADSIVQICNESVKQWEQESKKSGLFHLEEIDKLIMEVVINTFFTHFDLLDPIEFAKFVPTLLQVIKDKLRIPFKPLYYLSPVRRKYENVVKHLRNMSSKVIRQRLRENNKWDDLLGHYIREYRYLDEETLIQYLCYQVSTFLSVGYLTTAGALQWLIVTLSKYPAIEKEVGLEINRVIGSRLPQYEDLNSLPYLSAVIKETMRLNPPVHVIMRQAKENDEINGFFIPANAGITLSLTHIQRHPDFWSNPEGFDPLRFIDNPLGQKNRFAFIPFGAGMRNCIGSAFANMEIMLSIVTILQRFRLFLHPYTTIKPIAGALTTRPNVDTMFIKNR